jgi:hypothetical protein
MSKKSGKRHQAYIRKARATHLSDTVQAGLAEGARARAEAEDLGLEMPEDVRQIITNMRKLLHDNGIPWEMINRTPGLHPITDQGF